MPQSRPFSLMSFIGPPPPLLHPFYLVPKKTVSGTDYFLVYLDPTASFNQLDFNALSREFNIDPPLTFWNGPNEIGKAVIAKPIPAGTQPAADSGLATVAFNSTTPADNTFTELVYNIANDPSAQINDAGQALYWLNENGMWTNYVQNSYTFAQKQLTFTSTSDSIAVPAFGVWNYCDGAARTYFNYIDAAAAIPAPRWIAANLNNIWAVVIEPGQTTLYEFNWNWISQDVPLGAIVSKQYSLTQNFNQRTGISTYSDFEDPSRYLIAVNQNNNSLYKLDLTTQVNPGGPLSWNNLIFEVGGNLEALYGNPLRTENDKYIILGINSSTGGFYLNQYIGPDSNTGSNAWGIDVSIQLDTANLTNFSPDSCNLFTSFCISPSSGEIYGVFIFDSKSYKVWRIDPITRAVTYTGVRKQGIKTTSPLKSSINGITPMNFSSTRSVIVSQPDTSTERPFFYYDVLDGRAIDVTPPVGRWPYDVPIAFSTVFKYSVLTLDVENKLIQWSGRGFHPFAVGTGPKQITPDSTSLSWEWRPLDGLQGTGIAAMDVDNTTLLLAYNNAQNRWCILDLETAGVNGEVSWQRPDTLPWVRTFFGSGFPIGNPIFSKGTTDDRAVFLEFKPEGNEPARIFIVQYWFSPDRKDLVPEEIIEVTSDVVDGAISKSTRACAIFSASSADGNFTWIFLKSQSFTFYRIDTITRQKTQVSMPGFSLNSPLLNSDNLTNISALSSPNSRFKDLTYYFEQSVNLAWPDTTAQFYLAAAGSPTDPDSGYLSKSILSSKAYSVWSKQNIREWFVSTDGYIVLGNAVSGVFSGPDGTANFDLIFGNSADLYLDKEIQNTDGSFHGVWYKNGTNSIKFVVECGEKDNQTKSASYLINVYRDANYHWIETRLKSTPGTITGRCGIYSETDTNTDQLAETTSKVFRGSSNGLNWQYMGQGSVRDIPKGLRLTFVNENALQSWIGAELTGDPYNVATWNTYLIETGSGLSFLPFSSVAVLKDSVILAGGNAVRLQAEIFSGIESLIAVVDEVGCVTIVGVSAFKNAVNLAKLELPAVEIINEQAFAGATSLGGLQFPVLTELKAKAFASSSLSGFVAPLLQTVGAEAFSGTLLTSISLPSVTTIGEKAFVGTQTHNITSISIPACTQLGLPNEDNSIFASAATIRPNFTLTIPSALMTVNGGQPDPDIAVWLTGPTPIVTVIQV